MNELQVFSNNEFGQIRTMVYNGEPWMIGKDVAVALGYSNSRKALDDHVDVEDKLQGNGVTIRDSIGREQHPTIINESGLYSLVLSSKLPGARKFRRWVTSEVLPSIRKTGGYNLPKDFPSALRALADTEERRLALLAENKRQRQAIADFEPIKNYVDTILSCEGAMAVSQIAADYHVKVHPDAAGARGGNQAMGRGSTPRYIWPWMRMVCRCDSLLLLVPQRIAQLQRG